MDGFDYFVGVPRMAFLPARALYRADSLRSLHTGASVPRTLTTLVKRGLLGRRASQLIPLEIPGELVRGHPGLFLLSRMRNRLEARRPPIHLLDRLILHEYQAVARACRSPLVCGPQSGSVELFKGRDTCIMEQFAPPASAERAILEQEMRRFPGWMLPVQHGVRAWDYRMVREWEMADAIWTPSPAVVDACVSLGARPSKFRVIPYPVPRVPPGLARQREWKPGNYPLRVVFAGTVGLYKGIQYLYDALHRWPNKWIDLHLYGPSLLTREAMSKVSTIATVHGAVDRRTLMTAFSQAHVLLFPSLSEGSALVTLEATATGLPVVATHEAGPPASARIIPARDPKAISDALTLIIENPEEIPRLSTASLECAAARTEDVFCEEFASFARGLIP